MHSITGCLLKTTFCGIVPILFSSVVMAAPVPLRLDLYDGADNHLMYMTFKYTPDGRNTGRSIFMADETFMRDVVINYDGFGRRINEVSYNFNGDTIYVTDYRQVDNGTSFGIHDRFNLDQAGDRVVYSNTAPLSFGLVYEKTGKQAAAVSYTTDAASGQLQRVDISGQSGTDSYYGLFSYGEVGISHFIRKAGKLPPASIQSRASRIDVKYNLCSAGSVRCELLTLSGRRVAVLFNGTLQPGQYTHHFNLDKDAGRISNGVYLIRVSVNDEGVLHSRYLHQSSIAGGVR